MKALLITSLVLTNFAIADEGPIDRAAIIAKALQNVTTGSVLKTTNTGKTLDFNEETSTFFIADVNNQETSIILKEEGAKIYSLVHAKDAVSGQESKHVQLSRKPVEADVAGVIDYPLGSRTGDVLTIATGLSALQTNEWLHGGKSQQTYTFDLTNFFCAGTVVTQYKDVVVGTTATNRVTFPSFADTATSSCEKKLTTAELKGIDLKKIQFCDLTTPNAQGEVECSERDMSALVQ